MSEHHHTQLDDVIHIRVLRVNAAIQGIVTGILLGTIIFVATNWLVIKGGAQVGPHLALLGEFFIGYKVTLVGSIIGFGYGFLCGFVLGYFAAKVYNLVADLRDRN